MSELLEVTSADGAHLCVLPGQGHVAIDTAPHLIATHLREALSSLSPR